MALSPMRSLRLVLLAPLLLSCRAASPARAPEAPSPEAATLARVYYWKARPEKLEEYSRYIRTSADSIDEEARRQGAFLSVTTYVDSSAGAPWTHMRIFLLRDRTQFAALPQALDAAGTRLEPDPGKRRARGEYSATLRDRVGEDTLAILR